MSIFHTLTVNTPICPALVPVSALLLDLNNPFDDEPTSPAYVGLEDWQRDELRQGHEYREAKAAVRDGITHDREKLTAAGWDITEALEHHCDSYEGKQAMIERLGLSNGYDNPATIRMRAGKREAAFRRKEATRKLANNHAVRAEIHRIQTEAGNERAAAKDAAELAHIEELRATAPVTLGDIEPRWGEAAAPVVAKPAVKAAPVATTPKAPAVEVEPEPAGDDADWARSYVAELAKRAPGAARKLEKSLAWQISQLGTVTPERWRERAKLAFDAKVR